MHSEIHWGAVLLGTVAGVGGVAIPVGILLLLGVADTTTFGGQIVLILLGFVGQFLAGHVAARIAPRSRALNGGLAAIALYFVVAVISIAAGEDPGIVALAFGAMVALVMGTAAAVLVEARSR